MKLFFLTRVVSQLLEDKTVEFAIPDVNRTEDADTGKYRFAGTLLASLFSALFWTGLLAAVGAASGYPPSSLLLVTMGTAIAGYLIASLRLLARAKLEASST